MPAVYLLNCQICLCLHQKR